MIFPFGKNIFFASLILIFGINFSYANEKSCRKNIISILKNVHFKVGQQVYINGRTLTLKKKIGAGQGSQVFLTEENRYIALKVNNLNISAKSKDIHDLKAERKHLKMLKHAGHNVPEVYHLSPDKRIMEMEYLPGLTAHQAIEGFSEEEGAKVIFEILDLFEQLHRDELYFTDLHIQNILLHENGKLYIIDPGLFGTPDTNLFARTIKGLDQFEFKHIQFKFKVAIKLRRNKKIREDQKIDIMTNLMRVFNRYLETKSGMNYLDTLTEDEALELIKNNSRSNPVIDELYSFFSQIQLEDDQKLWLTQTVKSIIMEEY